MVCGPVTQGEGTCNQNVPELQRARGRWRDLPKARGWQRGDESILRGDQASPPELAGSHHRHACFRIPLSHPSAGTGRVEAVQHKLSRTVPAGTRRDPVPAATVVLYIDATLRRFLWLAGLLLPMLPVPQGRAREEQPCLPCPPRLGWQLSAAVLHRAATQSSSRDASSSNNAEESVTLEKTPHLLADQSVLGPDMLKYLCCK